MTFLYKTFYVFSGFGAFALVLYTDFPTTLFSFSLFSVAY